MISHLPKNCTVTRAGPVARRCLGPLMKRVTPTVTEQRSAVEVRIDARGTWRGDRDAGKSFSALVARAMVGVRALEALVARALEGGRALEALVARALEVVEAQRAIVAREGV